MFFHFKIQNLCYAMYTVIPDLKYPGELNNLFSNTPVKNINLAILTVKPPFLIYLRLVFKYVKIGLIAKIS